MEKYKKKIVLKINLIKIWILLLLVLICWVDQKFNLQIQNQLNRELKWVKILQNQWSLKNVGHKFYLSADLWLLLNRILHLENEKYKINHQLKKCHLLNHLLKVRVLKVRYLNNLKYFNKTYKPLTPLMKPQVIKWCFVFLNKWHTWVQFT